MPDGSYVDDNTISDDEQLWRRINPVWFVPDDNRGGLRPSSAAFDDSKDGSPLSVLLASVVRSTGRNAADVLSGFNKYALASFAAGAARSCGQGVDRTPLEDEPAHASVFGRKTKPVKRHLANAAQWVIAP
jgi:hypothetical protein